MRKCRRLVVDVPHIQTILMVSRHAFVYCPRRAAPVFLFCIQCRWEEAFSLNYDTHETYNSAKHEITDTVYCVTKNYTHNHM